MAYMLDLFSMMTGIDISYKTVERLYSDPELETALHNLLVLILKKKKINEINCCGDATGYSLMISKHYSTEIKGRRIRPFSNRYLAQAEAHGTFTESARL